jgi:hypothetical protein
MLAARMAYSAEAAEVQHYRPNPLARLGHAVTASWLELTRRLFDRYQPERHYMRGPGPAWQAKHGNASRTGA